MHRCLRSLHSMASKSYADAVAALNTLQTNASAIKDASSPAQRPELKLPLVEEYLSRIGYQPQDLNKLNIIHVTGTKGKGSTCTMVSSILQQAYPDWKIGLYTSPHLVAVRERIRINGVPISEDVFAKYFFDVWNKYPNTPMLTDRNAPLRPMYFRFLTLMAFHVFLSLKVDAAVFEVGIGGLYDDTNIIPQPVVTGVSSIGYDHMTVLGNTLGEIAFQKGGIFKEGVPAFTVEQPREALEALQKQASSRKALSLAVVTPTEGLRDIPIGLQGAHQVQNAALAVTLASAFASAHGLTDSLSRSTTTKLSPVVVDGLKLSKWPGRCQQVSDVKNEAITWFLDGAHTAESLQCCLKWFMNATLSMRQLKEPVTVTRVLVVNCTKGRSSRTFIETIKDTLEEWTQNRDSTQSPDSVFQQVIFCTNVTYADGNFKKDLFSINVDIGQQELETQRQLAKIWQTIYPTYAQNAIHVLPSIEHAVTLIRSWATVEPVHILVTGSLHLVGGILEVTGLSYTAT